MAINLKELFAENAAGLSGDRLLVSMDEKARERDLTVHERAINNAMDGDLDSTIAGGDMLTGEAAAKAAGGGYSLKEREKKEKEYRKLLNDLAEYMDNLNERMRELDRQIEEANRLLDGFHRDMEALRDGKKITGEDGALLDKKREAAVQEYEQRTGQTVDRNDQAQLSLVVDYTKRRVEKLEQRHDELTDILDKGTALSYEVKEGSKPDSSIPKFLSEAKEHDGSVTKGYSESSAQIVKEPPQDELTKTSIKAADATGHFNAAATGVESPRMQTPQPAPVNDLGFDF